jgi:NAD(P)H-nitrite reductase large subunit
MKTLFSIIRSVSAAVPSLPISPALGRGAGCHARPRRMTRCECAEVPFSRVAALMRAEGLSVEQACDRTGCGRTCTGCLPDLEAFLRG